MDADSPSWPDLGELLETTALIRVLSPNDSARRSLLSEAGVEAERVRLKIVREDLPLDIRRALRLSAPMLRPIRHPHVAPILANGLLTDPKAPLDSHHSLAYWLELEPSRTWADLGVDLPPWETLLPWVLDVLSGLSHLHAAGLVLGGFEASDIGLFPAKDGALRAKIMGIWMPGGRALLGERSPPELRENMVTERVEPLGPWSDLWSLGAVLWELFIGQPPGQAAQSEAFAPRITLPPGMSTLLTNLLHDDPLGRYDLAADVRTEILALSSTEGGGATVAKGHGGQFDTTLDDVLLDADPTTQEIRWNRPISAILSERMPAEPPGPGDEEQALIGRTETTAQLWRAARAVMEGQRPSVVLLSGAAGVGRTAVVSAFTRLLEEQGHAETIWMSHGPVSTLDDGVSGAYRSWIPAASERHLDVAVRTIEAMLRREGAAANVARSDALALLHSTSESGAPAANPSRELFRRLRTRAWRGLSCVVIDDIRWSAGDSDSMPFVDGVLQRAQDHTEKFPLLVIVILRDSDVQEVPALGVRVDRWIAHGAARIDLPPLDPASMAALAARFGAEPHERDAFVKRSAGSPLLLRLLAQGAPKLSRSAPAAPKPASEDTAKRVEGADDTDTSASASAQPAAEVMSPEAIDAVAPSSEMEPLDMAGLAAALISTLADRWGNPRRVTDLFHLLSLAGRTLPSPLARHFSGEELDGFVACCGWFERRGARITASSGSLHEAMRSLAHARSDKAYLHRRLSRGFAKLVTEAGEGNGLLEAARHAIDASDPTFAVPVALKAAARASRCGHVHTLDLSSSLALEAVDDPRTRLGPHRAEAALWRGRAHLVREEYTEAGHRFDEACAASDARGDDERVAEAQLWAGWARLRSGALEHADRCFTASANRAHQWGTNAAAGEETAQRAALQLEAGAIAGKGWVEMHKQRWDDADILFARSLARCTQLSNLGGAAQAVLGQAHAARCAGRLDEAHELYSEAIEHFREAAEPVHEVEAQLGLALTQRQRASDNLCEVLFATSAARALDLGDVRLIGQVRLGQADLARNRGDRARASQLYAEVSSLGHDFAIRSALGLAQVSLDARDLDNVYEQTRIVASLLENRPNHMAWPIYRLVVATLLALRRDHTQTWQWLWSSAEVGLAQMTDRDCVDCLLLLCEESAAAGWGNVLRLAGKLGVEQLGRLGDEAGASALKQKIASALIGSGATSG